MDALPADWEVLFLGHHDEACVSHQVNLKIANSAASSERRCVSGMYGYVVNTRATSKLLNFTVPLHEEIDAQLARFFGKGLNAYWPMNNIATSFSTSSDRATTDAPK